MVFPNCGPCIPPGLELHKPQRAPLPNRKFRMPLHPLLMETSITAATIERIRVFIVFTLICIASVFVSLQGETEQNYVVVSDVQTQHRVFSATMC